MILSCFFSLRRTKIKNSHLHLVAKSYLYKPRNVVRDPTHKIPFLLEDGERHKVGG